MRLPFIIAKIRKGQVKNMKKTMNTVQAGREMQERSFKRMMAYQKKAEQAAAYEAILKLEAKDKRG